MAAACPPHRFHAFGCARERLHVRVHDNELDARHAVLPKPAQTRPAKSVAGNRDWSCQAKLLVVAVGAHLEHASDGVATAATDANDLSGGRCPTTHPTNQQQSAASSQQQAVSRQQAAVSTTLSARGTDLDVAGEHVAANHAGHRLAAAHLRRRQHRTAPASQSFSPSPARLCPCPFLLLLLHSSSTPRRVSPCRCPAPQQPSLARVCSAAAGEGCQCLLVPATGSASAHRRRRRRPLPPLPSWPPPPRQESNRHWSRLAQALPCPGLPARYHAVLLLEGSDDGRPEGERARHARPRHRHQRQRAPRGRHWRAIPEKK